MLVGPPRPRAYYGFILREEGTLEDFERGQPCPGCCVTLGVAVREAHAKKGSCGPGKKKQYLGTGMVLTHSVRLFF